jgi:hypothetical protein
MKIVREFINEKFIENSDPIDDLNIGKKTIDINDLINTVIKELLHNLGYKPSTMFDDRFNFSKFVKNGDLNICIDLVDEQEIRFGFGGNITNNKFKLNISFIPYKFYLKIFKELDYDKEKTVFDKIILLHNINGIRFTDKTIAQKIEFLIRDIETEYK